MTDLDFDRAARAISDGNLVIYPTETVYGLGADALDARAVERVFEAKNRDRSKPVSMAVPDIETAGEYTTRTDCEREFMREFLPGPVTVVVEADPEVPDVLTAGRDRVGIRIPDHDVALELLGHTGPITATSANVSSTGSVRTPAELGARIRDHVAVVLDDGTTPGGGSTVVDVTANELHRRGHEADAVAEWLSA
jgi:L-threonylcarbamoyladenylate synthase